VVEILSLTSGIIGIAIPLFSGIRDLRAKGEETRGPKVEYRTIREFWAASRRDEIRAGTCVTIRGTISKYGPMIVGDPRLKREKHLEYRRTLLEREESGAESAYTVNPSLSLTAGNTVWRFEPLDNLVYMGLYQGIVRNSIPIFVEEEYYHEKVNKLFAEQPKQYSRYFVEVELTGILESIKSNFLQFGIRRETQPGIPTYGLYVGRRGTKIKSIGEAGYVDGDIWVGLEHHGEERLLSRFLDLADKDDLEGECSRLKEDINKYLPNSRLIHQFDQLDRLIGEEQSINVKDLWETYCIK